MLRLWSSFHDGWIGANKLVPTHIAVLEQDRMHAVLIPQIHCITVAFLGNDQLCPLAALPAR